MHAPIPRRATYDDVVAASENVTAELIDGALRLQAQPTPKHQFLAGRIANRLARRFEDDDGGGPGGWRWLLDPAAPWIEAFRAEAGGWRAIGESGAGAIALAPFEATPFPLP